MVANVQSSVRTAALFAPEDPVAVVTAVNRQLQACSPVNRYATLFYGVFDGDTRTLNYVNAGHNSAVVIRRERTVAWLESSAPPVGFFAEIVYERQAVQCRPGDLILAYTDGIVEGTNAAGEEWGIEGLLAAVKHCRMQEPEKVVEVIFAALDKFSVENQIDDATVLAALVH